MHRYGRRQWHPTPVLLPGKSHGWRSLVGCSPWGRKESDMTEWLHFHFSVSCIGEGNGNPLQCSCLEHPRDRGAWWAAVCGVAQSWTRLSSSSSTSHSWFFNFSLKVPLVTGFLCICIPGNLLCIYYTNGSIQDKLIWNSFHFRLVHMDPWSTVLFTPLKLEMALYRVDASWYF